MFHELGPGTGLPLVPIVPVSLVSLFLYGADRSCPASYPRPRIGRSRVSCGGSLRIWVVFYRLRTWHFMYEFTLW